MNSALQGQKYKGHKISIFGDVVLNRLKFLPVVLVVGCLRPKSCHHKAIDLLRILTCRVTTS